MILLVEGSRSLLQRPAQMVRRRKNPRAHNPKKFSLIARFVSKRIAQCLSRTICDRLTSPNTKKHPRWFRIGSKKNRNLFSPLPKEILIITHGEIRRIDNCLIVCRLLLLQSLSDYDFLLPLLTEEEENEEAAKRELISLSLWVLILA